MSSVQGNTSFLGLYYLGVRKCTCLLGCDFSFISSSVYPITMGPSLKETELPSMVWLLYNILRLPIRLEIDGLCIAAAVANKITDGRLFYGADN